MIPYLVLIEHLLKQGLTSPFKDEKEEIEEAKYFSSKVLLDTAGSLPVVPVVGPFNIN